MKVDIDGFKNEDAKEIVALIHRAMFETNITDYSKEDLIEDAKAITEVSITERASWTHFMYLEPMIRLSVLVQLVHIGVAK